MARFVWPPMVSASTSHYPTDDRIGVAYLSDRVLRTGVNQRTLRSGPIFGVDIQSGDVRGSAPAYALVIIDGSEEERDVVSRRKLRRLIQQVEPAIVATDNVYELAPDKDGLVHLLRELPPETRLVQVTGAERPEPLSRVAHRHDIPYEKESMAEARAAALLAAANVGYHVTAFDDTTHVKVSRGRSTGKGGWSEDRYTRRIHGAVKRRAREIEDELDQAGLTYERDVTEKYGGFSAAEFVVDAPPTAVPIGQSRRGDVRVEVTPGERDGIEFRPLAKRRDRVLVGIDPGTTTAAAIVDTSGTVLDVMSTRTADTADLIGWIIERGRPFLVATDVTPMPTTVEKIRRSFDAAGWEPTRDLLVDDKLHRTREVGYDNDHERDAIAAALFAFDHHADQFERIRRKVPATVDTDDVIAEILRTDGSVEAVLQTEEESAPESTPTAPETNGEPAQDERRVNRLERRIDRLETQLEDATEQLTARNDRIETLEDKLDAANRAERRAVRERRTVSRLEREIDRLGRELDRVRDERDDIATTLDRLKELWRLDHDDFDAVAGDRELVPVKPIEKLTVDAIETAADRFGLVTGDVLLLRDATGAGSAAASRLAKIEPRVILKHGGLSDAADAVLFDAGIPIGDADTVRIREIDDLAVANANDVSAVIENWRDLAAERRRQERASLVDQVISEHRADRKRADGE